jgi:hypothetical protein
MKKLLFVSVAAATCLLTIEAAAEAKHLTYQQMARTPGQYIGDRTLLRGEVARISVEKKPGEVLMFVYITPNSDDIIAVRYHRMHDAPRILPGDIISIDGIFAGLIRYQTELGSDVDVPAINATSVMRDDHR